MWFPISTNKMVLMINPVRIQVRLVQIEIFLEIISRCRACYLQSVVTLRFLRHSFCNHTWLSYMSMYLGEWSGFGQRRGWRTHWWKGQVYTKIKRDSQVSSVFHWAPVSIVTLSIWTKGSTWSSLEVWIMLMCALHCHGCANPRVRKNKKEAFFLSFFLGFRRPNLITGLSGWRTPD
jgi:hypothetical protein